MALEFKPKFDVNDIKKAVQERLDRIENAIIETLGFIGEEFVRDAREKVNNPAYQKALSEIAFSRQGQRVEIGEETPSFKDHTGNLRSSIGFVILKNGEPLEQTFKPSDIGTDKETGMLKAMVVAKQISANFPKGFVLIVVAGMEYAAAVESKGYDVITGSSLIAEDALRKAVKSLSDKIPQMK